MEINNFLGIAIVGAALSVVVQTIKGKFGIDKSGTKALCILLAVIVGGAYWYASQLPIWQAILGVLAAASTVYAFIFNSEKITL